MLSDRNLTMELGVPPSQQEQHKADSTWCADMSPSSRNLDTRRTLKM